jgi:predicted permease
VLPAPAVSALFLQFGLLVLAGVCTRRALGGTARGARLAVGARSWLNRFVLSVSMPALVFQAVQAAPLGPDVIQVPLTAVVGMAGTALIAWWLLARLYGHTPETGGLVLAASAGSVSFLGIPIVRTLFGPAQAHVAVYFAILNVPLALLAGAAISSRVRRSTAPPPLRSQPPAGPGRVRRTQVPRQALRQFAALPVTWAFLLGLALRGNALPPGVSAALHALGASVGPTTMVALGLGLHFERSLARYRMVLPAVAIKLAVSPLVVCACAWALGLSGLPLAIVSLQGAMPTQVLSVVVADRYRLDTGLVGLTLAMDTALAFVLLPLLVAVVRTAALA